MSGFGLSGVGYMDTGYLDTDTQNPEPRTPNPEPRTPNLPMLAEGFGLSSDARYRDRV